MEIVFKNGTVLEISQEVADLLTQEIAKGSGAFQMFLSGSNLELMVNVLEILFIRKKSITLTVEQ